MTSALSGMPFHNLADLPGQVCCCASLLLKRWDMLRLVPVPAVHACTAKQARNLCVHACRDHQGQAQVRAQGATVRACPPSKPLTCHHVGSACLLTDSDPYAGFPWGGPLHWWPGWRSSSCCHHATGCCQDGHDVLSLVQANHHQRRAQGLCRGRWEQQTFVTDVPDQSPPILPLAHCVRFEWRTHWCTLLPALLLRRCICAWCTSGAQLTRQ